MSENSEDNNYISNMLKAKITAAGGIISNLLIGTSFAWFYISEEYLTFLSQKITGLNENYKYFFISLILSSLSLSNLLVNIFEFSLHIRVYLSVSYLLIILSQGLLKYSSNILIINLGFALYGFGCGISYYPLFQNIYLHFIKEKSQSKIIIVFQIFYYLSPSLFYYYSTQIITKYNIETFLFINIIIFSGIGFISVLASIDYLKECFEEETDEEKINLINNQLCLEESTNLNSSEVTNNNTSRRSSTSSISSVSSDIHRRVGQRTDEKPRYHFTQKLQNMGIVLKNIDFYKILIFFTIMIFKSICLIYNVNKINIGKLIIAISIFSPLLLFIQKKNYFSLKIFLYASVLIEIILIISSKYSYNIYNKEVLSTIGTALNYLILVTIIEPLTTKIYGNEIDNTMESIIKFVSVLTCWIKYTLLYKNFKDFSFWFTFIPIVLAGVLLLTINIAPFDYNIKNDIKRKKLGPFEVPETELENINQRAEEVEDVFDDDVKSDVDN